jgi:peptidoglycan/LPS O-acetylase OafA/YrhL
VIALGLLAQNATPIEGSNGLTPHLAPVFVVGLLGAGIIAADERVRRLPWHWLAVFAGAPVLLLIATKGSVWTVSHYFWVDLAIVPAMTMLLVAVSVGRPVPLMWLLETRPVRSLGTFSYSLYLIHLPIIMVINRKIVPHFTSPGLSTFWLTLTLGLPISLMTAWLFATAFEFPFQRHRSWASLAAAVYARWNSVRSQTPLRFRTGSSDGKGVEHGGTKIDKQREQMRAHPGQVGT